MDKGDGRAKRARLPAASCTVKGRNAQRAGDFMQMIPDRPLWRWSWGRGCSGGKGGVGMIVVLGSCLSSE